MGVTGHQDTAIPFVCVTGHQDTATPSEMRYGCLWRLSSSYRQDKPTEMPRRTTTGPRHEVTRKARRTLEGAGVTLVFWPICMYTWHTLPLKPCERCQLTSSTLPVQGGCSTGSRRLGLQRAVLSRKYIRSARFTLCARKPCPQTVGLGHYIILLISLLILLPKVLLLLVLKTQTCTVNITYHGSMIYPCSW
jgi:hypothetical protein